MEPAGRETQPKPGQPATGLQSALYPFWLRWALVVLFLTTKPAAAVSEPSLPQIFKENAPAVVLIQLVDSSGKPVALGSGFLATPAGAVVTNHHVIQPRPGARLVIRLFNGDTYDDVWLIRDDPRRDFAVLMIKASGLPVVRLGDSDRVEVGEQVVAIGNPEGLERTYTAGIVSALRSMPGKGYRFIQHQAPISHGSSGGPLLNAKGEVIGINTFFLEGGQNLNGAVSINYVKPYLQDTPTVTYAEFARSGTISSILSGREPANPGRLDTRVIKIATQSPLSGRQAVLGEGIKLGAQLALETLKGPVESAGFRLELMPFDDRSQPATGVANARVLSDDPDVLLVIGHLNSGVAIPSSEVYKEAALAMISPANTNPVVTDRNYSNVNRISGRDDVQGVAAAYFARNELHASSAYVVHDQTQYGQAGAEFFRAAAVRIGLQVVGFEGTREKTAFEGIVADIRTKRPDVIYFGGIYDQAGAFFKQAREAGVRATFLGPDGMDSSDLAKIAGQSAVGLYYVSAAGPAAAYSGAREFVAAYKARFNRNPEPYSAEAYDATLVGLKALEVAIRQAGGRKPTRQEVSAAIRRVQGIQGVTGVIDFDDKGDRKIARYLILRVESSNPSAWGQNRIVKSISVAPPQSRP